jgi:hypothetical protein
MKAGQPLRRQDATVATVFLRNQKLTYGFASASHDRPSLREFAKMPAQQRDLRKNYIGLVNDKAEEQRAAESQAKADHGVTDYFRALVAAVRNRHGEAR